MTKVNPYFSIITVCYNSEKTIERTITSLRNQSYQNFEYIIIDGGSTDSTLEIIKKNLDVVSILVSEKDEGIYDAMNKGIDLASGEIIGIINSDDWYENDTLENIFKISFGQSNLVIHGLCRYFNDNEINQIIGYHHSNLPLYSISHPTCFVSNSLYLANGKFDTKYKIAADYDLLLRFYLNKVTFIFVELVIANFQNGGASSSRFSKYEFLKVKFRNNQISKFDFICLNMFFSFKFFLIYILEKLKSMSK
jgi:glycosyltransferase involved in cell wall biosynthesis